MRDFLSKILLKRKLAKHAREKCFYNFNTAKTVGILFNASNGEVYSEVKLLLQYFNQKKIKVEGLGFASKEQIDAFYKTYTGFQFFCEKDFNYLKSPKSNTVIDFINEPFDILIDMSFSDLFYFTSICQLSVASFKAGSFPERQECFDFFIDLPDSSEPSIFTSNLKHYLENINGHNNDEHQPI